MERFMEAIQAMMREVGIQFIRAVADLRQQEDGVEDGIEG